MKSMKVCVLNVWDAYIGRDHVISRNSPEITSPRLKCRALVYVMRKGVESVLEKLQEDSRTLTHAVYVNEVCVS